MPMVLCANLGLNNSVFCLKEWISIFVLVHFGLMPQGKSILHSHMVLNKTEYIKNYF